MSHQFRPYLPLPEGAQRQNLSQDRPGGDGRAAGDLFHRRSLWLFDVRRVSQYMVGEGQKPIDPWLQL